MGSLIELRRSSAGGYAELLCRSGYSFLEGASHPEELMERAAELGLSALALSDRHGVYGIPRAFVEGKKHPALKLIVGAGLRMEALPGSQVRPELRILVRDRAAYGLLCRAITLSHADKGKGEAFLRWDEWDALLREHPAAATGWIILLPPMETGNSLELEALVRRLGAGVAHRHSVFPGQLYLPLVRRIDGLDAHRTHLAREFERVQGVPVVAANDVHVHTADRRKLQDAVTCIREAVRLDQAGTRLFANAERHLKSPAEMRALYRDWPEAVDRTLEIATQCTFSPSELRYRYPSEWIPAGETAQSYLVKLVWAGAERRYGAVIPSEVCKQLEHELRLTQELVFADYFLTIWEIVEFARSRDIYCQGRGSAANSAICFCLGITAIDPVRMNLLFERFLSAERGDPPDIDVDFEHERREEVIQHIYQKYGRHRAAMVTAVVTYRGKMARREIRKVFGLDVDALPEEIEKTPLAAQLVEELKGFPRHLSIHSGGFTLSADPIIETVPVEPARMEGRTIVQWDKEDLACIGLIKVDVLSLGMLTALHRCFNYVAKPGLTFSTVPADDKGTYEMIQRGDTVGTFQIESRAQMNMLGRLRPENFYDLVIEVAIVRPGPIVGKMVHPYLKRRRGLEPADLPHPALGPILGRTLGVPLFQEQIMKIAMVLAGFTAGEADELRRSMGGWKTSRHAREKMERLGRKLQAGLLASGLPAEFAERIYLQIQGFSEYGFPESHAASFALIAYVSAYLKCHYPAEFACALINSQPMGFYSNHSLIDEVKRHGVCVLPIDPNLSEWECTIERASTAAERPAIRLGLSLIDGLHRKQADHWIEERRRRPFTSIEDFLSRVPIRREVLSRLAMGDVLRFKSDEGEHSQREALWSALERLQLGSQWRAAEGEVQPMLPGLSEVEAIEHDYRAYRASVRGHPLEAVRRALVKGELKAERVLGGRGAKFPLMTVAEARAQKNGSFIRIGGLAIVIQRPPTAKGTVFATLEDETGLLDIVLHKPTFERYRELLSRRRVLVVRGVLHRDRDSVSFVARELEEWRLSQAVPEPEPRSFR